MADSFPDRKYGSVADYMQDYFARLERAAASIEAPALERAAEILSAAFSRGSTLYTCGNGGSSAISDHFVCDHSKLLATDTDLAPRVVSLSSNMPMITAIANDLCYDDVFVYQLRMLAKAEDVLITVSSSGDSENVVRAHSWALENGLETIAMTGFSGGRSAALASVNLHVGADNYGVIEDTHQSLMHILGQFIRQSRMDERLVASRNF